jgi:hypothetical protein
MALTYRSVKGSALTITELDNNFRHFTGSHSVTGSLTVSGSGTFTNIGPFNQTGNSVFTGRITCSLNISASDEIKAGGEMTAKGFNTNITTGTSADSITYTVNGRKVEMKNQLSSSLSDGDFASFTLFNSSIAANSIILGSFTGNTAGAITGSIITVATVGASTGSIQIHNETGGAIADDTGFTASFILL